MPTLTQNANPRPPIAFYRAEDYCRELPVQRDPIAIDSVERARAKVLSRLRDSHAHHPSEFPGVYSDVIRALRSLVRDGQVETVVLKRRRYYRLLGGTRGWTCSECSRFMRYPTRTGVCTLCEVTALFSRATG